MKCNWTVKLNLNKFPNMIANYFTYFKSIIQQYTSIYTDFNFESKEYSNIKGFIGGKITFIDESQLDFIEVKDIEKEPKTKYKYHYMDKDKNLIFRYDNAEHHREIATFPHHKHTPNGIEESKEPTIETIMEEIIRIITSY